MFRYGLWTLSLLVLLFPDRPSQASGDGPEPPKNAAPEATARSLNDQAVVAAEKKDITKALELLNAAILLNPELPSAYLNRAGIIYTHKGDLEHVVADCTKALELTARALFQRVSPARPQRTVIWATTRRPQKI